MVLTPFALCAMAATLSVVPLALSRVATPAMVAPQPVGMLELVRLTPAGMGSSFTSGLILGAIYGLLPLYFTDSGASLSPGGGHDGAGDPGGCVCNILSDVHLIVTTDGW